MSEQLAHQSAEQSFTWDQVQTDIEFAKGDTLEAENSAFITQLAKDIKAETTPGMTIQGTDEFIPGTTTYRYERTDAEGNVTTEEVPSSVAKSVMEYAAGVKAKEAADKAAVEYAKKAALHADKKLTIHEVSKMSVSELSKLSGLSQAEIHKQGKTAVIDKINDTIIAKEVAKADAAAAKQAEADVAAAKVRTEKEQAQREQSRKDHEAAWAKNADAAQARKAEADAVATQIALDEKITTLGVRGVMAMSVSELAALTGMSQSEIHKQGKMAVIDAATARITERAANAPVAPTLTVPENTAAQARTSELGAMLKAHDRKLGQPKSNPFENAPNSADRISTELPRPVGLPTPDAAQRVSNELPRPTGLSLSNELPVPTGAPVSTELPRPIGLTPPTDALASIPFGVVPASVELPAPRIESAVLLDADNPAAANVLSDNVEPTPASLRDRARARFDHLAARLYNTATLRGGEAGADDTRERSRRRKAAAVIGGALVGVAGVYVANRFNLTDHLPFVSGGNKANTATNLGDVADTLGAGTSKAAEKAAKANEYIEAADALDGVPTAPRGTGAAEQVANMPSPNAPSVDMDPSTFTIADAWEQGDPTAWSWAQSQGIPENKIPSFLNEVMGSDWAEQARNMKIGDSIIATPEQIAKYRIAG